MQPSRRASNVMPDEGLVRAMPKVNAKEKRD
jgi:hypothetical protein